MRYEIRAMSAGEILDTGLRLVRTHFVPLVGISAIVNVPLSIGESVLGSDATASANAMNPTTMALVVVTLLSFVVLAPIDVSRPR